MKVGTAIVVAVVLILGYHFWTTKQAEIAHQTAQRRFAIDQEIGGLQGRLANAKLWCPNPTRDANSPDPTISMLCKQIPELTARISDLERRRP
jgi:hypothetical protein